ncbi:aspartate/glutamate racemase family protein [Clostridium sp. Cult2]|uniref:aspartate/glutamate racemase family protein n=1 Tax=Clostridium sp. Cult2 TaxID=2079003 RepID=UPI001F01D80B|nr:amino acid racemase [Clostridium sp. Cult2]
MILGIIGGMGPAATCNLYEKIIQFTPATKDQEHLHIVIDSNAQIPDRTECIIGNGENPKIEMVRSAIKLETMGVDYIAIPCNTAHYFYDDISQYVKVPIIHMIDETAFYLSKKYGRNKDYLLLATEGTYMSGIYKKVFEKYDLNIIEPDKTDKEIVMKWIYGVKSSEFDVSLMEFESLINKYVGGEDIPAILGCTELPVLAEKIGVSKKCVDPISILAKVCVELREK